MFDIDLTRKSVININEILYTPYYDEYEARYQVMGFEVKKILITEKSVFVYDNNGLDYPLCYCSTSYVNAMSLAERFNREGKKPTTVDKKYNKLKVRDNDER